MAEGLPRSRCDHRGHIPTGHCQIQHEKTVVTLGMVAKEWWADGRAGAGQEGAGKRGKRVRGVLL